MSLKLESFAPAQKQTTTDEVFNRLYQAVISLELPPGTKMSEAEIAARLNVSRQPVRDAFYRLSKIGLLLVRPQRATRVTKISEEAVFNAVFVRAALEVECLRTAFQLEPKKLTTLLKENIAAQEIAYKQKDPARFHQLDERFHLTICECAEQAHVWALIQEQKAHLDRVRYLTLSQEHRRNVADEHICILEALEESDLAKAERKLRLHLGGIGEHLEMIRQEHIEYFEQH